MAAVTFSARLHNGVAHVRRKHQESLVRQHNKRLHARRRNFAPVVHEKDPIMNGNGLTFPFLDKIVEVAVGATDYVAYVTGFAIKLALMIV